MASFKSKPQRHVPNDVDALPKEARKIVGDWLDLGEDQPTAFKERLVSTAAALATGDSQSPVALRDLRIPQRALEILARGREMVGRRPVTIPERIEFFTQIIVSAPRAELPKVVRQCVAELKSHYPITTTQRALSQLRSAIKSAAPKSLALKLLLSVPKGGIGLTTTEVQALRRRVRVTAVMNQAGRRAIHDPKALVKKATESLESNHWSILAAGLACATGRRLSEILKYGEFKLCVPDKKSSIQFRGQRKTRKAQGTRVSWYSHDVLAPSPKIVAGLKRLRELMPTDSLSYNELRGKYSEVQDAVRGLFGPEYTNKDLRAINARICFHAFAPPEMDPLVYFARHLGHKRLESEQPNSDTAGDADTLTASFYLQFYIPEIPHRLKL